MQLFVGVGGVCSAWCFGMKKGLRNSEGLCTHDGGDEGDRTPDLLTASQALSQLSYAPVRKSTIREPPRRCKDNFGKTFRGGAPESRARGADADVPGASGPLDARLSPRGAPRGRAALPPPSHQAPPRPPPGPPATKPAHLLRLAGIPRPWRLGQK